MHFSTSSFLYSPSVVKVQHKIKFGQCQQDFKGPKFEIRKKVQNSKRKIHFESVHRSILNFKDYINSEQAV